MFKYFPATLNLEIDMTHTLTALALATVFTLPGLAAAQETGKNWPEIKYNWPSQTCPFPTGDNWKISVESKFPTMYSTVHRRMPTPDTAIIYWSPGGNVTITCDESHILIKVTSDYTGVVVSLPDKSGTDL